MKASEIRDKSQVELEQELTELKSELFKLRFQLATNQLDNPMRLKEVKKSIARVKTVIRERELGISVLAENN
jgi:large subunit ribosomal protein L29